MSERIEMIPPNQTMLDILRLYLEKYDILSAEDKATYSLVVALIAHPPVIHSDRKANDISYEDLRKRGNGVDY